MSKFNIFTKYISQIQTESIGEWILDRENGGTTEHPIQMPFVDYSDIVRKFINDVYFFEENNKDMELTSYGEILKDNGIEWSMESVESADVSKLNAQCVLALIMGVIRAERFCEGALLDFFKNGCMIRWLVRLNSFIE